MFGTVNRKFWGSAALPRPFLIFIGLVMAHMVMVWVMQGYFGLRPSNGVLSLLATRLTLFLPVFFFIILLWQSAQLVMTRQSGERSPQLWPQIKDYFADRAAISESVISFGLIVLFMYNFNTFKSMIPQINPFAWDQALHAFDLFLHGGVAPWQRLWPLLHSAFVIRTLDIAYFIWFLVVYFAVFIAIFGRGDAQNRRAFLIATVLAWTFGGNALATVFSSAGPVFFQPLGLGAYYAGLTQHLDQIHAAQPLLAFQAKEMLWQGYAHGGDIVGISAFPSMHMGAIAVVTCFAFSYARWLGWVLVAFSAVIFIGSVGLAWHYAADGYIGVAVAYLSWRAGLWCAARA